MGKEGAFQVRLSVASYALQRMTQSSRNLLKERNLIKEIGVQLLGPDQGRGEHCEAEEPSHRQDRVGRPYGWPQRSRRDSKHRDRSPG